MSALSSLLDRLGRAYAAIGEVEAVAARSPGDRLVMAGLSSLRRDAANMEKMWEEECRKARVEICRYRLLPEQEERYRISEVMRSLLDFQELFSQIYDALQNGAKKRARISVGVQNETAFEFGFSYPGSLGVALMLPSEADMFGGKFDEAVTAFLQIMSVQDENEVRDLARALGEPVVKKTYDWSSINFSAGYSVDVTWNTAKGTKRGALINVNALGRLVEIIGRTSEIEYGDIVVRGTLVGIDTVAKRFRFVDPDGLDFAGQLGDEFPLESQWAVNVVYTAHIKSEVKTEYATQKTQHIYRLINLERMGAP